MAARILAVGVDLAFEHHPETPRQDGLAHVNEQHPCCFVLAAEFASELERPSELGRSEGMTDLREIKDVFSVESRPGTMVLVAGISDLPVSRKLTAIVRRPDGSTTETVAYKDWLLRRTPAVHEVEGFLLVGLEKSDIPDGSSVEIRIDGMASIG
ncbi:hypothetical protein [Allorhizobium taibaishanense]|uniref:Uncharacterized protein n=1 Tax=Allorhizobium taibaishanense TaxID=887144 RepID=A0A1Q9AAA5_9HYPH|nr:hypothetical protein [Allorhizobium taibaishanense]MBB4006977.1 hypothetical protein [Allorhizobium taibaishanense]OLP51799.1 hypothetical protein BJF91_22935 [Allorhizobium taibaishanense]